MRINEIICAFWLWYPAVAFSLTETVPLEKEGMRIDAYNHNQCCKPLWRLPVLKSTLSCLTKDNVPNTSLIVGMMSILYFFYLFIFFVQDSLLA